jgi:hypothetical protein
VVALAGAAGVGGLAATAEASTGAVSQYGPPPPPPPSLPGFTTVITSVTVWPAGRIIGPVTCDGGTFILGIPAGAFRTTAQITLTCGDLGVLAGGAFTGFALDTALGVLVTLHGAAYPGTFYKPLTLTADDAAFTPASVVGIWNGSSFLNDMDETSAPGVITASFYTNTDLGFMSPATTPKMPVPDSTTPVTGKPLAGEGILAGVLLALGAGGLGVTRRRRRQTPGRGN